MTTSIKAPKAIFTNSTSLALGVETQSVQMLFLQVPIGDDAGCLMTYKQFDENSKWTIGWSEKKSSIGDQDQNEDEDDEDRVPDARVGVKSRQQNIGEVTISRRFPSKPATFKILIERFTPPKPSETIVLRLVNDRKERLDNAEFAVHDAAPKIKEFRSDKYFFKEGAKATLSWTIEPAGRYRLRRVDDDTTIETAEGTAGKKKVEAGGTYKLEAIVGDTVTSTCSITVLASTGTHLRSTDLGPSGSPGCADILGIYQHKGMLYAVVRDVAPGRDTTSIWFSEGRFTREHWVPIQTPPIPIEAASRPGVVFAGNLYFMGGSSYDPDRPGSGTSYFNLEAKVWVGDDPETAWPKEMKPRMGHALLASPDDGQLWVIGGYNGDGGAKNDIWKYSKSTKKWTPITMPKWQQRCLFGAVFCDTTLLIAGGFDSPGGYPTYDDVWYCDTSQNIRKSASEQEYDWKKFDKPLIEAPDPKTKQYRGCALASLGDHVYAFVSYGVLSSAAGYDKVFRLYRAGYGWDSAEVVLGSNDWVFHGDVEILDYYRFDATTFAGGIFIHRLAPAAIKDTELHYAIIL